MRESRRVRWLTERQRVGDAPLSVSHRLFAVPCPKVGDLLQASLEEKIP